jgi:hypothetical protein
MDAFESLISALLERDGYWVKQCFKVELTKEEKRKIGRPSSPRWEIDLIAYKASENNILAIECKSYIDSYGVRFSAFGGGKPPSQDRMKLFNDRNLRNVVFSRLAKQLEEAGLCAPNPSVQLCFAAGNIIREEDRAKIAALFKKEGWIFWDPKWIRSRLEELSGAGYEDSVATIVSKLIFRNQ